MNRESDSFLPSKKIEAQKEEAKVFKSLFKKQGSIYYKGRAGTFSFIRAEPICYRGAYMELQWHLMKKKKKGSWEDFKTLLKAAHEDEEIMSFLLAILQEVASVCNTSPLSLQNLNKNYLPFSQTGDRLKMEEKSDGFKIILQGELATEKTDYHYRYEKDVFLDYIKEEEEYNRISTYCIASRRNRYLLIPHYVDPTTKKVRLIENPYDLFVSSIPLSIQKSYLHSLDYLINKKTKSKRKCFSFNGKGSKKRVGETGRKTARLMHGRYCKGAYQKKLIFYTKNTHDIIDKTLS